MLDKKKIWFIFFFFLEFKMGHKAVETTCNINAFGPGTANERTVQWWFKKLQRRQEPWRRAQWLAIGSSVQSLSRVWLFATPWIAARQASLSITNSQNSLKLTSIESVMPSSHLILCRPLLLLSPIPPSIRDFSSESTLHMRWPRYWNFSFS